MTTEIEQPKHSPIGASICHRWWECPASVSLAASVVDEEVSIYAAEGTAAHEVGEALLNRIKTTKGCVPEAFLDNLIGTTIQVDDHEIEVTEEMCEAVDVYTNEIIEKVIDAKTGLNFLEVETAFNLDVDPEAWGTNDACLHVPFDHIHIWDYKHGQGTVVEVKNNKQLMYYALGALKGKDVEKVITTIVQPRAYHPDGPVRSHTYTIEELKEFEKEMEEKIALTRVNDPIIKTGSHCKFCKALSICPGVKKEVNAVAVEDFRSVQSNNSEKMTKLLEMTPRIIDFLKANEAEIKIRAERGEEISGFKLVKAKSNRIWKSDSRVISEFGSKFGENLYGPRKLLSPAKMEKLLKGKISKDALLPYIEKPDKGLSLVKESDPRKTVDNASPQNAFKDV